MIYPDTDVIVYALSNQHAEDEARQYGITGDKLVRVTVVTPYDDASVALALPVSTPWTRLTAQSSANQTKLVQRFGPPLPTSTVFNIQNDNTVGKYRKGWQKDGTAG